MPKQYSQLKAMLSLTRASLLATFKSPQSIFFSLFFPLVLIWIFSSLSGRRGPSAVDIAFEKGVDTTNDIYQTLSKSPLLKISDKDKDHEDLLRKGRITAIVNVLPSNDSSKKYNIHLRTTSAGQQGLGILYSVLQTEIGKIDKQIYRDRQSIAGITQTELTGKEWRQYKMIDFFLPGMIGFSLIGAAVFGVAFLFYSLRETLVLKRLYATPIKRSYIILGESIAKVIFHLLTVVVLIAFGHYAYDFTLAQGWLTFINILVLSFIALLVFMGFGFFFSSVAKNQNVIPVYANLFMFPQYFLSGTFFPKEALPSYLQSIVKYLPLTALNDAMRNVAFEGSSLISCWPQILILLVWGVIIYVITIKVFRWE